MPKTYDSRYLDEDRTLLYTANNLYKHALKVFNDANILKEQQGLNNIVKESYTIIRSQLTKALLFGNIEACTGLAAFNERGIGGLVSPYNQKLFLTIGSKRGNQVCIEALKNLQSNNFNVEQEVNAWLFCIDTIKKQLGKSSLDTEITTQDLVYATDTLKSTLTKYHISLDVYNSHIFTTKAELDQATNYTPSTPPKQAANYYDPYHNKNNTTTTSSNEQSIDTVKKIGHTPEKHHCDIL